MSEESKTIQEIKSYCPGIRVDLVIEKLKELGIRKEE